MSLIFALPKGCTIANERPSIHSQKAEERRKAYFGPYLFEEKKEIINLNIVKTRMIQLLSHVRSFVAVMMVFISYESIAQDGQYYIIPNTERDSVIKSNNSVRIYKKDLYTRYNIFDHQFNTWERLVSPGTAISFNDFPWFTITSICFNRTLNIQLTSDTTNNTMFPLIYGDVEFTTDGQGTSIINHYNGKIWQIHKRISMPINEETKFWYYDFVQEFDEAGNIKFYRNIDATGNGFEYVYGKENEIINMIQFKGYKPTVLIGDQPPQKMGNYYRTENLLLRMRKK